MLWQFLKVRWAESALVVVGISAVVILFTIFSNLNVYADLPSRQIPRSELAQATDERREARIRSAARKVGLRAIPSILQEVPGEAPFHCDTVSALSRLGPKAVPSLVAAFDDPNPEVRLVAVRALAGLATCLGEQAPLVMAGLVRLLDDSNDEVRYSVILLLGRVSADKSAAVAGLVRALTTQGAEEDPIYIRQGAAYVLGKIGPAAQAAVPELTRVMRDPGFGAQPEAAVALWRISHDTNLVVGHLSAMNGPPRGAQALESPMAWSRIQRDMNAPKKMACSEPRPPTCRAPSVGTRR